MTKAEWDLFLRMELARSAIGLAIGLVLYGIVVFLGWRQRRRGKPAGRDSL